MDNFKSIDKALNINSEVVPTPEDVVSKKGQIKKVENANQAEEMSLKKTVLTLAVKSVGIKINMLKKTFSPLLWEDSREARKTQISV